MATVPGLSFDGCTHSWLAAAHSTLTKRERASAHSGDLRLARWQSHSRCWQCLSTDQLQ